MCCLRHVCVCLLYTNCRTYQALNVLLDVDTPWTLVVHDPSGLSELSDMSKVEVGEYQEPVEEGQATEAAAEVAALSVQDNDQ